MRARAKWALALAVIAAAGALAASRLLPFEASDPAQAGPKYKDVTAERGAFRVAVTANGLVRPIDRIELKSKASGEVIRLPIEVGDRVEKGALIAQLDQVEERAALAQAGADLEIARAQLDLAEKNFARRQQLFSSNVISKEVQDQTELDLAVARSKRVQADTSLERARDRLEDTVITAPVAGVILQKYVESGQIIASGVSNVGGGTPIADIADMGNVYVEAGIDEIDIGKIAVGQKAAIRAEAYPENRYEGQIVRIAPEARVEQNVTLFDVVVQVANSDANLKSGMNTTVEIVIVDEPDVLTIPVAALRRDRDRPGGSAVAVLVKQGNDYVVREIRTGRSDHRVVEVLEGLADGAVLGIPMASRLKEENDLMNARMRERQSFGSSDRESRQPSDKGG
ncbi:MAG: efflux RND transporter periplasmic adaptor subunit [Myxococcales bacterium]|nr:efflux RND transporter periplasmic adaptor subunit [Myxococcales bacterium]